MAEEEENKMNGTSIVKPKVGAVVHKAKKGPKG
jgi:hypothetical protein